MRIDRLVERQGHAGAWKGRMGTCQGRPGLRYGFPNACKGRSGAQQRRFGESKGSFVTLSGPRRPSSPRSRLSHHRAGSTQCRRGTRQIAIAERQRARGCSHCTWEGEQGRPGQSQGRAVDQKGSARDEQGRPDAPDDRCRERHNRCGASPSPANIQVIALGERQGRTGSGEGWISERQGQFDAAQCCLRLWQGRRLLPSPPSGIKHGRASSTSRLW